MSDRELKKYIIIVVLIVFFAGEALVFAFMAISRGNFGSLADWISGIGAIGAIVGVIYQVHEQRTEFLQSKKADIAVALGVTTKLEKNKTVKLPKRVVQTYCYNIGYSAGSFRFIGFATDYTIEKLKNNDPETKENKIKDPEHEALLCEERKFNRVGPRETSNYINYSLELLTENFNEGDRVYAVYDDPLGKLYFSIDYIDICKD